MKRFLLSAALFVSTTATAYAQDVGDMLALVTHDNPQIQLMSMVLSVQAAQRGTNVHVLLCGNAADMALENAPESVTRPQPPLNVSPQSFMDILLLNDQATVEVCALYLPSKGITPTDLRPGVGVASPGDMSDLLTAGNTRVVSF